MLHVAFPLAVILLLIIPLHAEIKTFDILDLLRSLKVAPNTEAIATRQGYVLHGVEVGPAGAKPQAGDSVTALVELRSFDGKLRPSQWIIRPAVNVCCWPFVAALGVCWL